MYSGSSRLTVSPETICWRCRSISAGAKPGSRASSDSMRIPFSKLSFITTMLQKVRSVAAPAPIAPPMKSIASFISSAVLLFVP